ncbi:A24 family peptidase [Skermania piniformis]|uniref:A24 family peptidase n=2 Tax=Skermania pinensis TaxID=39122 RepID=A0ABX8SDE1_9ACTN|nr:A24 family peptidase [Skermania piniformis]
MTSLLAFTCLLAWCAWLSAIDLREHRLPNPATAAGAVAILGYAASQGSLGVAAIGALLLAGCYLVVHLTAPAALGAGDVKLAVGLGAATALGGAPAWVLAALLAPVFTATAGLIALGRGRPGPLAHGPAMCAATLTALAVAG